MQRLSATPGLLLHEEAKERETKLYFVNHALFGVASINVIFITDRETARCLFSSYTAIL